MDRRMHYRVVYGLVYGVLAVSLGQSAAIAAEEQGAQPARSLEQVGTAVKNFAAKLEQEVGGAVKKLSESEMPQKVGAELQRSAVSLGNKVEQTGQKVKEAFQSK